MRAPKGDSLKRWAVDAADPSFSNSLQYALFGILAFVLPLALAAWLLADQRHLAIATLIGPIAMVLYCAKRLSFDLATGRYSYVTQFLFVYLYVNWGIAPLIQLPMARMPWIGDYTAFEVYFAYFVVAVGMVSFELAFRLGARRPADRQNAVTSREPETGIALLGAIMTFGIIGVIIFLQLDWRELLFVTRSEAGDALGGQLGSSSLYQLLVKTTYCMPLYGGTTLVLLGLRRPRENRYLLLAVGCGFLLFALAVGNPVSAPRYWFATVLLTVGAVLVFAMRQQWLKYMPLALIGGYLFVYPMADIKRDEFAYRSFLQAQSYGMKENFREAFLQGDYDSLQQVMNTIRVAKDSGHRFGKQLLGPLLFWVPRSYWPEKPLNTGELVAQESGYNYTNLSCPLWAEGFIDFHLAGVAGFLALYGFTLGKAMSRTFVYDNVSVLIMGLSLMFAPYSVFLIRGGLLSAFAYFTPALFMFAVLLIVCRLFPGRSRANLRPA